MRKKRADSIIDALIKMMIIDDHLDPREHAKISEIYFYLHGKHPDPYYIEEKSFKIMNDQDLDDTSEVSRVIAESIKKGSSRTLTTISLVEVMMADKKRLDREVELLEMIADLWDTQDILEEELQKYVKS